VLVNNSLIFLSDSTVHCVTPLRDYTTVTWFRGDSPAPLRQFSTFINLHQIRTGNRSILLSRGAGVAATGLYRCEVPNSDRTMRILYVGVYNHDEGESD
jgi:hypothetical protein